jgi:hypothetical protein
LLHLVGKGQPLVYLGASYGNGKLGDSIWEIHHKSSVQGARRACAGHTLLSTGMVLQLGPGTSNLGVGFSGVTQCQ